MKMALVSALRRNLVTPSRSATVAVVVAATSALSTACGGDAAGPGPSPPPPPPVSNVQVTITSGPAQVRQGDVVTYEAEARNADGSPATGVDITWSVEPPDAGFVETDGRFVGYGAASANVVASAGGARAERTVTIQPRGLVGSFTVLGHAELLDYNSSHISVFGTHAYTGTTNGGVTGCARSCGGPVMVWDVSNPASPVLVDEVVPNPPAGGRLTRSNDIEIHASGAFAVVAQEGDLGTAGSILVDAGIVLLDLANPAHPQVITRFNSGLAMSHNLWIDGDMLYVAQSGYLSPEIEHRTLKTVDVSDPANPNVVSTYTACCQTHDVNVRDGFAFVSQWNAGLHVLDVGGGTMGGSASSPIRIGSGRTLVDPNSGGGTHEAWYWPAAGYAFVNEEREPGPLNPGTIYVLDVHDLSGPQNFLPTVATFSIPGAEPHNFWLDEQSGVLYVAWHGHGVWAIDVTGPLLGDLREQGREIANIQYDSGDCETAGPLGTGTCSYSVQLHDGLVYVSDYTSGLWVLDLSP